MTINLSLKPGETVVINGAVVTNGDQSSVLIIDEAAAVLRDCDVMREEDARTPASHLYRVCQHAYLDAEAADSLYPRFLASMDDFMAVVENPRVRLICAQISLAMMNSEYYRALSGCRELIAYEALILGEVEHEDRQRKRA